MTRAVIRQGMPCRKCGCTDRHLPRIGKLTGRCVACSKEIAKRHAAKRKEQRQSGIYDDAKTNNVMAYYLSKWWTHENT